MVYLLSNIALLLSRYFAFLRWVHQSRNSFLSSLFFWGGARPGSDFFYLRGSKWGRSKVSYVCRSTISYTPLTLDVFDNFAKGRQQIVYWKGVEKMATVFFLCQLEHFPSYCDLFLSTFTLDYCLNLGLGR